MVSEITFVDINKTKARMDHIYDQPDPRAYFHELKKLSYAIPGAAKPLLQKLISHRRRYQNNPVHVLDLGCSYGVNAALLKHDLSMGDLYDHWGQKELAEASPEEVIQQDQCFFANLDEPADIRVTGLDAAANAVAFGMEAGLLDEGVAVNLETEPLPPSAEGQLASVDLVTSTGCVGYVTERTFERLAPVITCGQAPWFVNFVLRMFPFESIATTLSGWGYATAKLPGQTFVQRHFASIEEQIDVVDQLLDQGIDPSGKELKGDLLAECYISLPARDATDLAVERLVTA